MYQHIGNIKSKEMDIFKFEAEDIFIGNSREKTAKQITLDEAKKIIELYLSGVTVKEVVKIIKFPNGIVSEVLRGKKFGNETEDLRTGLILRKQGCGKTVK